MALDRVDHRDLGRVSVVLRLWKSKSAAVSMVFIVILAIVGLLAPVIAPKDPTEIEIFREVNGETINPPFPPSVENLFGTDQLGRDIFSRVLYAIRTSLVIGLLVRGGVMFVGV